MSLRPGGGSSRNPFERFAKGAGAFTEKAQVELLEISYGLSEFFYCAELQWS